MASRSPHSASSTFLEGVSRRAKRPLVFGPWVLFLLVVGAQFAFGMWMNSRGFLWNDALSRIQASPSRLENLILSHDFRFRAAVAKPRSYGVSCLLVPRPSGAPSDFIVVRRPALWVGGESDFELVKSFPETPSKWRLYKVVEQLARERRTDQ